MIVLKNSASGQSLLPMVIFGESFPNSNYSMRGPGPCLYAKLPNGYIDEDFTFGSVNGLYQKHNILAKEYFLLTGAAGILI